MKNILLLSLSLMMVMVVAEFASSIEDHAEAAEWSRQAVSLGYEKGSRRMEIPSPDGRKKVIITDVVLSVLSNGRRLSGTEDIAISALSELLWSPDSLAFAITESYGGSVGDWHVRVFLIAGDALVQRLDVDDEVANAFKKDYSCEPPEPPNIGALKWFDGGQCIVVIAEVPPHSSCAKMGMWRGFLVNVQTGKLIREWTEREVITLWNNDLGNRFEYRHGPDDRVE
jgi:hypothetical protein